MKKLLCSVLCLCLMISLSACEKKNEDINEPTVETTAEYYTSLPSIVIDGKSYQITVADGVRGLEKVHDGIVFSTRETEYNKESGFYESVLHHNYARADGTVEENYQGEIKAELVWAQGTGWDGLEDLGYKALSIQLATPFISVNKADSDNIETYMKENGYFLWSENYYKFYTENGVIDTRSDEFEKTVHDYALQKLKNNPDYSTFTEQELEDKLKNKNFFNSYIYSYVIEQIRKQVESGTTTVFCAFREDVEEDWYILSLYAPEELIFRWYEKWSPNYWVEPWHY